MKRAPDMIIVDDRRIRMTDVWRALAAAEQTRTTISTALGGENARTLDDSRLRTLDNRRMVIDLSLRCTHRNRSRADRVQIDLHADGTFALTMQRVADQQIIAQHKRLDASTLRDIFAIETAPRRDLSLIEHLRDWADRRHDAARETDADRTSIHAAAAAYDVMERLDRDLTTSTSPEECSQRFNRIYRQLHPPA